MPIEITQNDLNNMIPQFRRALQRSHDLTAQEVWGNLREYSPQDHGRLAGSWTLTKRGEMYSTVGTSVKYALVQNDGSKPYDIFPRSAKALRFVVDGDVIFAKRVRHPGIKGKQYIEKSIDEANARISEFVEMALDEEGL